jgi:hypothetical protein
LGKWSHERAMAVASLQTGTSAGIIPPDESLGGFCEEGAANVPHPVCAFSGLNFVYT